MPLVIIDKAHIIETATGHIDCQPCEEPVAVSDEIAAALIEAGAGRLADGESPVAARKRKG